MKAYNYFTTIYKEFKPPSKDPMTRQSALTNERKKLVLKKSSSLKQEVFPSFIEPETAIVKVPPIVIES
jgi:hypothetical protein